MNKVQFTLLNVIAGMLAILILANVFVSSRNQKLNNRVIKYQVGINNARQAETILRQMTLRIAQASDQDAELRKIMVRHELKATLTVDGKKREYP